MKCLFSTPYEPCEHEAVGTEDVKVTAMNMYNSPLSLCGPIFISRANAHIHMG